VGVSLGALCLLFTHFTQPGVFGSLLLQSGSFFQPRTDAMETGYPFFKRLCGFVGSVLDGSLASSVPRISLFMTCGAGEENIINNRVMASSLHDQGCPITFHEQPDAHNWTCWRDSAGAALMRLLAP
jgi:enterochelin esterase family protein